MTWKLDRGGQGHGGDWNDWDDWNDDGWRGGPAWYAPPAPC
jgi:hypothetical protein